MVASMVVGQLIRVARCCSKFIDDLAPWKSRIKLLLLGRFRFYNFYISLIYLREANVQILLRIRQNLSYLIW